MNASAQLLFSSDLPANSATRSLIGGKAAALAALGEAFPIPAWFALSCHAFTSLLSAQEQTQLNQTGKLSPSLRLPQKLLSQIRHGLQQLEPLAANPASNSSTPPPQPFFAVRSSATSEDGAQASYAGQLQSFLQVPAAKVPSRILDVWASAFAQHIHHYRAELGQQQVPATPAVLIQQMVNAQVSGVAFSADPLSGNRQLCIINAIEGLGEDLVQGLKTGDQFTTSKSGKLINQKLAGKQPVLSTTQLTQVTQLCAQVEAHFGSPQDIEWAFDQQGKLFLLQARPITTLPEAKTLPTSQQRTNPSQSPNPQPTQNPPSTQTKSTQPAPSQSTLWDNSNIVESYSGVSSPLTFSFARHIYEHVYLAFCQMLGVPQRKLQQNSAVFNQMLGSVNGHIYYNLLNWYRVLALLPGYQMNRAFMEQMMGVKEALPAAYQRQITPQNPRKIEQLRDGLSLAKGIFKLAHHQLRLGKTKANFTRRLETALQGSENLPSLSLPELAQAFRQLQAQLLRRWDAPLINDFLCMMAFGISRKFLGKAAGDPGLALHAQAMIGQGDIISAEPVQRIQQMANLVLESPQQAALTKSLLAGKAELLPQHPQLEAHYHAYLEKFGQRCLQELKLESPTLHDDPSVLLQTIGQMTQAQKNKPKPKASKNTPDWQAQLTQLLRRKPLTRLLAQLSTRWARARVRDRENLRFERTRIFGRVRQLFLEIGQRLHAQGQLPAARDIFLLEIEEVLGLIEGTSTLSQAEALATLIEARRQQQAEFQQLPAPPNRFASQGASFQHFRQLAQKLASQNPSAQSSQSNQSSQSTPTSTLQGIACSPGLIRARARVIHEARNAQLEAGEILVAQFTDPGWITLFANASGVLVERGSLLSHSAIVAREMGIPAIVAIEDLLKQVQSGDLLELNGSTGEVNILERKNQGSPKGAWASCPRK